MEAMTFNLHLLTHLPKYVLRFGPLWTHSCFPYERYNGIILNGCHGKSYYLEQIAQESRKLEFVSFLEKYFPNPQELKVLKILSKLKSAINYNYINKEEFQVYVNNDITIQYLGKPNLIFLKFEELKLLKKYLNQTEIVATEQYFRLICNFDVIHSIEYDNKHPTCSNVIQYFYNDKIYFGQINQILLVTINNKNQIQEQIPIINITPFTISIILNNYIYQVEKLEKRIYIYVKDIIQKVVQVSRKDNGLKEQWIVKYSDKIGEDL